MNKKRSKKPWAPEEDRMLASLVSEHGTTNWKTISRYFKGRIGKQCRERWINHLNPNLVKSKWTEEEDEILLSAQKKYGNKWSKISKLLPGRSDNNVKNHWNSRLKKSLVCGDPAVLFTNQKSSQKPYYGQKCDFSNCDELFPESNGSEEMISLALLKDNNGLSKSAEMIVHGNDVLHKLELELSNDYKLHMPGKDNVNDSFCFKNDQVIQLSNRNTSTIDNNESIPASVNKLLSDDESFKYLVNLHFLQENLNFNYKTPEKNYDNCCFMNTPVLNHTPIKDVFPHTPLILSSSKKVYFYIDLAQNFGTPLTPTPIKKCLEETLNKGIKDCKSGINNSNETALFSQIEKPNLKCSTGKKASVKKKLHFAEENYTFEKEHCSQLSKGKQYFKWEKIVCGQSEDQIFLTKLARQCLNI